MPNITQVTREFRARLARGDDAAAAELAEVYAGVSRRLAAELRKLDRDIAAAKRNGVEPSPAWLRRQARYRSLLTQTNRELLVAAEKAGVIISEAARSAVSTAEAYTAAAAATAPSVAVEFDRLPREQLVQVTGAVRRGPLGRLLAERARARAREVESALLQGVAEGWNPVKVGRAMDAAVDGGLRNAQTIARTEVMRAHRETTRLQLHSQRKLTPQWRWWSSTDDDTCAFCWAMHGRVFTVDEPMPTHPNCRCQLVPMLEEDVVPAAETGPVMFAQLDEARQRRVLGPAKFAAFRAGELRLPDLVATGRHPDWGPVGRARSLREVLGDRAAQRFVDEVSRRP